MFEITRFVLKRGIDVFMAIQFLEDVCRNRLKIYGVPAADGARKLQSLARRHRDRDRSAQEDLERRFQSMRYEPLEKGHLTMILGVVEVDDPVRSSCSVLRPRDRLDILMRRPLKDPR
jgi:hypothetical protein